MTETKRKSCHYCNHLRTQRLFAWCRKEHLDGMIELPKKEKSTLYHRMEVYQKEGNTNMTEQAQAFLDTAAVCKDYDDEL